MKWYLSLKAKIILSFVGLVLLLGVFVVWLVYSQISRTMKESLARKGESIAEAMVESSRHLILTENTVRLQEIINAVKSSDNEISYIYILDHYNIPQAHTFQKNVPPSLLNLNQLTHSEEHEHLYIETENDFIRHITMPIDGGKIGFISLGLTELYSRRLISGVMIKLLVVAALTLMVGIIGMSFIARIITRSLGELTQASRQIGEGKFDLNLNIRTHDEISELGKAFNKMSDNLKEHIKRLNESEKQLSRAQQMATIGQMSAGLAHEINNPLDGIQRSINVIRNSKKSEINEQLFLLVSQGIKRIEQIVQQLLTYARYQPKFETVNINLVIEQVLRLTEATIKEMGIQVELQTDTSLPSLRGDPQGLIQVISNLFTNAIDAVGKNGKIVIQTRVDSSDKSNVEISFSDNGKGIPDEIKDKIFEPFFSTKEKGKGTGLGLTITKNIVELHNGLIKVESQAGKGTRFVILMPLVQG